LIRLEDFIKTNLKPVQKPLFRPASSDSFNAVADLRERAFNVIGGEGNHFSGIQPSTKKRGYRFNKVLNVGSSLGVVLGIKSVQ
jgi:hypothetical protein